LAEDSGQKTEKPTPKRLREARKEGRIPRSADLAGWFSLLVASYAIPVMIRYIYGQLASYFGSAMSLAGAGDWAGAMDQAKGLVMRSMVIVIVFAMVPMILSAAGMAAQGGITLTGKPLKPKLERISIKAGFKRLVSPQSAVDTIKAVVRLSALVYLVFEVGEGVIERYVSGNATDLRVVGPDLAAGLMLMIRLAGVVGVVIGIGDYGFQRWQTNKKLKMSQYELKQERRNTEGDQMIRGRRRSMHAKLSRNQMLSAVADASVVVVNPTHISVALQYEPGMAPKVVAKGGDELAFRIRERAFASQVPVVEAKALARLMHETIEVGEDVPASLYEAVAIIIAFVMRKPATAYGQSVRRVNVPDSKIFP